jgi:hypothetical protein
MVLAWNPAVAQDVNINIDLFEEEPTRDPHQGGPPPHAPAHGYRAKHEYQYYPDPEVYFDPRRELWFFLSAGDWRAAASLPLELRRRLDDFVTLELETDRPYRYHDRHRSHYPPGQAGRAPEAGPPSGRPGPPGHAGGHPGRGPKK